MSRWSGAFPSTRWARLVRVQLDERIERDWIPGCYEPHYRYPTHERRVDLTLEFRDADPRLLDLVMQLLNSEYVEPGEQSPPPVNPEIEGRRMLRQGIIDAEFIDDD